VSKHFLKILFISILSFLVLGIGIFFVLKSINYKKEFTKDKINYGKEQVSNETADDKYAKNWLFDSEGCMGKGPVEFSYLPMKPADFASLVPYGLVIDSHVTPIDHQYFSPLDYNSPRDAYKVSAVADGTLVEIQHRTGPPQNERLQDEYRLVFEHTCTFISYMDLITSLDDKIMKVVGKDLKNKKYWRGRMSIKAGQTIGRIGGQTLDFGVYNKDVTLNFINPASYKLEPWKIHTDKSIRYFTKDLQEILIQKDLRKMKPLDGKIDYDIDGKLIGNWFREGTNGYKGTNRNNYWKGHLAFLYDHIDPSGIIISIGNFDGKPVQGIVKKGSLDPAKVDSKNGGIKYELYQIMYYDKSTGERWQPIKPITNPGIKAGQEMYGTVLVQMLENGKIKFEIFPNKKASQVSVFTKDATIYVR